MLLPHSSCTHTAPWFPQPLSLVWPVGSWTTVPRMTRALCRLHPDATSVPTAQLLILSHSLEILSCFWFWWLHDSESSSNCLSPLASHLLNVGAFSSSVCFDFLACTSCVMSSTLPSGQMPAASETEAVLHGLFQKQLDQNLIFLPAQSGLSPNSLSVDSIIIS